MEWTMDGVDGLIERDDELAVLGEVIADAVAGRRRRGARRGRGGDRQDPPAGAGARPRARPPGARVLYATADEIEATRAAGGRARAAGRGRLAASRPDGPARLGVLALDGALAEPSGLGSRADEVVHALWWLIVELADEQPLALIVDDAQWADDLTLRLLRMVGAARAASCRWRWSSPRGRRRRAARTRCSPPSGRSCGSSPRRCRSPARRGCSSRCSAAPEPVAVAERRGRVTGGNPLYLSELWRRRGAGVDDVLARRPRRRRSSCVWSADRLERLTPARGRARARRRGAGRRRRRRAGRARSPRWTAPTALAAEDELRGERVLDPAVRVRASARRGGGARGHRRGAGGGAARARGRAARRRRRRRPARRRAPACSPPPRGDADRRRDAAPRRRGGAARRRAGDRGAAARARAGRAAAAGARRCGRVRARAGVARRGERRTGRECSQRLAAPASGRDVRARDAARHLARHLALTAAARRRSRCCSAIALERARRHAIGSCGSSCSPSSRLDRGLGPRRPAQRVAAARRRGRCEVRGGRRPSGCCRWPRAWSPARRRADPAARPRVRCWRCGCTATSPAATRSASSRSRRRCVLINADALDDAEQAMDALRADAEADGAAAHRSPGALWQQAQIAYQRGDLAALRARERARRVEAGGERSCAGSRRRGA